MQNGSLRGPREDPLPNQIHEDAERTALHDAASAGDEKTLQILLEAGSDRNAKDLKHGNTPLHEAAWRGYSRCVKALCALPQPKIGKDLKELKLKGVLQETRGVLHSALLGTRNAGGFSALHLAAQNGHNQSCREILLAGGDPDVQNNYGDTPLHTACRYGHAGATRILLSAKCDPNRTNLNGDTPLHISCAMGRRKLTRILLEAGSSLEIKNAQNETPRDITLRKNLPEILEILDNPIEIKIPKDRDRSSSNSKNADKLSEQKDKSTSRRSDCVANPANWSPYGCHYFPDPRSFPSPKLETLPKEPLAKGEQYYLDLAGNIRKGPIGVGNTCYCGPFFRHIEERISRNRKSIRKYVHKATERIDNKVQALALKTDDQIEQLTRTMIVDRIRCEGRRLHLEQWLKRGDPTRMTVGHHLKSKKNLDNTNTLTRCKSLELLDDTSVDDKKIQNSRSFDILDEVDVIVHRSEVDDPSITNNDQRHDSSQVSSDLKISKISDHSRNNSSRLDHNSNYSVSERLEELLAKTNEILELEKTSRKKKKQTDYISFASNAENSKKKTKASEKLKVNSHSRHSMYTENIIQHLKRTSLSDDKRAQREVNDAEFIEHEMKKITTSLLHHEREFEDKNQIIENLPPLSPEILKELPSQKEIERKSDQEHEKSSILSGSSQKNPSSSGSGYAPHFSHRLSKNHSELISTDDKNTVVNCPRTSPISTHQINYYNKDYQYFTDAFEKEHYSGKRKSLKMNIPKKSLCPQDVGLPLNDDNYQDEIDSTTIINTNHPINGLYKNSSLDDATSDFPNNISKSEKSHNSSVLEKINFNEEDDTIGLSEMANINEINKLKSRILNGSNWKSQALKKTQEQLLNKSSDCSGEEKGVNGIVQKFEIRSSEIKTLKNPTSGVLRRSKVQELVAKIQGGESASILTPVSIAADINYASASYNCENSRDENSESSEDEHESERKSERRIYANKPVKNHHEYTQEDQKCISDTEHYYYNTNQNIAQPQVASISMDPYYQQESSLALENQQKVKFTNEIHQKPIIVDARNLIPKDAYFHDLPNKNHMRPIVDKLPEKRMINFSDKSQRQQISPSPLLVVANRNAFSSSNHLINSKSNSSSLGAAARTRHPLPCFLGYNVPSTPQINKNHYVQFPIASNRSYIPSPDTSINRRISHSEKLLSHRKFTGGINIKNKDAVDHHQFQQQQHEMMYSLPLPQTITQSISITTEQAQVERDSNNDSGYSTKVGESSHGPSPSLSGSGTGTDFGMTVSTTTSTVGMSIGANNDNNNKSNEHETNSQKGHNFDTSSNNVTYFMGNIGASSLV